MRVPDHDAELGAILEQVEAAGLVEVATDADDGQAMRLTPDGERVARQLAMSDDEGHSRRTRGVILQNFVGTIGVDVLGVALAALGFIEPVLAAAIHVGSELAFILNAARLVPPPARRWGPRRTD